MKIESIGWQGVLGPSVSDRDPLAKLSKLVLALIMIIVLREAYYPITNQRTASVQLKKFGKCCLIDRMRDS